MTMTVTEVLDGMIATHDRAQAFLEKDSDRMEHLGEWRGLGFMLGDMPVVAAMDELTEVVSYPDSITQVPGAAPWMCGLTNYHGEVLPVTDLQCFSGGPKLGNVPSRKVLVVRDQDVYYGFLVSGVLGIQYFPSTNIRKVTPGKDGISRFTYEQATPSDSEEVWPIVSMAALVYDDKFLMKTSAPQT